MIANGLSVGLARSKVRSKESRRYSGFLGIGLWSLQMMGRSTAKLLLFEKKSNDQRF